LIAAEDRLNLAMARHEKLHWACVAAVRTSFAFGFWQDSTQVGELIDLIDSIEVDK
jgi:hypothetical protein